MGFSPLSACKKDTNKKHKVKKSNRKIEFVDSVQNVTTRHTANMKVDEATFELILIDSEGTKILL